MNKTPVPKAVAQVIQASARRGGVLGFASTDAKLITASDSLDQIKAFGLKVMACNSCGIHMTASADSKPFCVHCGSAEVEPLRSAEEKDVESYSDDTVAAITCSVCDAHNVVSTSLLTASAGKLHCTACGTHLTANTDSPVDPDSMDDEADEYLGDDEDLVTDPVTDVEPIVSEEDVAEDLENTPVEDNLEEVSASDMEALDVFDADPNDSRSVLDHGLPEFLEEDLPQEDADLVNPIYSDDTPSLDFEALGPDSAFDAIDTDAGEPLLDVLEISDEPLGFSASYIGNRLVAHKGHVAIASLSAANVKGNPASLSSPKYAQAVIAYAKQTGSIRQALVAFNFAEIKVKVVSQSVVKANAQKLEAKTAGQLASKLEGFTDGIAIAAAGLSRGTWRGHANPLRAAVEAELARAGVRNPKVAAARVFAENAIPYTETLVTLANDISKQSPAFRKELRALLEMTEETPEEIIQAPEQTSDADPEESFPSSLEARLVSPNRITSSTKQTTKVSVTASSSVNDILFGGKPLNINV